MKYEALKVRRITIVPPLADKQKIALYANGNMSEFILDAVREKIKNIELRDKNMNSIKTLLR